MKQVIYANRVKAFMGQRKPIENICDISFRLITRDAFRSDLQAIRIQIYQGNLGFKRREITLIQEIAGSHANI